MHTHVNHICSKYAYIKTGITNALNGLISFSITFFDIKVTWYLLLCFKVLK